MNGPEANLHVIGVRHHSPACATYVRAQILALQPAIVLIEGPSDFNPHLDDLRAPHQLPIAIFSYHSGDAQSHSSYSPFCAYSPEWQAIVTADEVDAQTYFCDLPSWHPDFGDRDNRYADPHALHGRYTKVHGELARRLGAEGHDAVWDTLVEQSIDEAHTPAFGARLRTYFDGLRPDGADDPKESGREAFMASHAAWALQSVPGRAVLLVCGGWHASAIRARVRALGATPCDRPELPPHAPTVRAGSYVVPYSYARLDRFTGYASGMPSPAYYEHVYDAGLAKASEWAIEQMVAAARKKKLTLSTADRIAWQVHAEALSTLRGHRGILRADLLDAALATLVKEALSIAPAWTEPGAVRKGNDPLLTHLLAALTGERTGALARGTRAPPLVRDIEERMANAQLVLTAAPRSLTLDWHEPNDRQQLQVLHRLRVLGMPGIHRRQGPAATDSRQLQEHFELVLHRDWMGAVIEAAAWGGTLATAAYAKIESRALEAAGDLAALSACIMDAAFAGLLGLGRSLVESLAAGIHACTKLRTLGDVGLRLVHLFRFGDAFDTAEAPASALRMQLRSLCEAVFVRSLWLLEGNVSEDEAGDCIAAVRSCRELVRAAEGGALDIDPEAARACFARCLRDAQSPPMLAGASLGYLLTAEPDGEDLTAHVRKMGRPESLGDFLGGLFALGREELSRAAGGDANPGTDAVLAAVDDVVQDWEQSEFLIALPALRGAFAWFPPRERERLAHRLLKSVGYTQGDASGVAHTWMTQPSDVDSQTRAMKKELRVRTKLARFGLL